MPKVTPMTGPMTMNPSDDGLVKKWKFRNDTDEAIFDFYLRTGPVSFLEIELPWGDTGNPPDMRKFTIREDGFEDASKEFDDEVRGKATLDPPIDKGKEFELEIEFDAVFEPKEYLELIPTDANGVTIEDDDQTTTDEPNAGMGELLDAAGKVIGMMSKMENAPRDSVTLAFDEARGKHVLKVLASWEQPPLGFIHLERKYLKRKAHYGLKFDK